MGATVGVIGSAISGSVGADIVGGALVGAAVSGIAGGNPLMGALTGGVGGGVLGAFSGAGAGTVGTGLTSDAAAGLGGAGTTFTSEVTPSILSSGVAADGTSIATGMTAANTGAFTPNLLSAVNGGAISGSNATGLFGAGGYNPNSILNKISNPLSAITGGTGQQSGSSNLASLVGAGMNVFSALNAQTPQSPTAAQQGANPWAPYASQAASQLNALNQNPNLVYGLPGYQFQQQQGAQGVNRSAAAAGGGLSGGTLAALNQQAQSTASDFFNTRVNQLSQMAGATPQNLVAGQQAYNLAQYNQSAAQANQANMLASGLAGLGNFFFS